MNNEGAFGLPAGADELRARRASSLHIYAVFTVIATLFLITAGGLVTSTGSGLAVPDWPLSYGMLFPPMVGGILYEHGHRMVAATIGLLTIGLATWLWRRDPRRWVRRLGFLALAAVVTQGLLGGLTVLLLLPTAVSVAHACVAQAFFCLLVTIAVVTSPGWFRAEVRSPAPDAPRQAPTPVVSAQLFVLAAATTAAIYVQLILGAVTRHTKAGLAISDFPLANGYLIPPLDSSLVAIQFAHRVGALIVLVLSAATVVRAARECRAGRGVAIPAFVLLPLLAVQITLGAFTVTSRLAVLPATTHVTTGAALLGVSLVLALMSYRHARLVVPVIEPAVPLVSRTAPTQA